MENDDAIDIKCQHSRAFQKTIGGEIFVKGRDNRPDRGRKRWQNNCANDIIVGEDGLEISSMEESVDDFGDTVNCVEFSP